MEGIRQKRHDAARRHQLQIGVVIARGQEGIGGKLPPAERLALVKAHAEERMPRKLFEPALPDVVAAVAVKAEHGSKQLHELFKEHRNGDHCQQDERARHDEVTEPFAPAAPDDDIGIARQKDDAAEEDGAAALREHDARERQTA